MRLVGRSKTDKKLLAKAADVSAKGPGNMRPLQVAALEGHARVVRLLLENGTLVDQKNSVAWDCSYLRELKSKRRCRTGTARLRSRCECQMWTSWNCTPGSCELGKADLARLLLDGRADVDATGNSGYTALQVAVFSGGFDMVELILAQGGKDLFLRYHVGLRTVLHSQL